MHSSHWNPHGIEPGGFIPILIHTLQSIKIDKERKKVLCIQKAFNAVFKNGFNSVLGLIPRLPAVDSVS